VASWTADQQSTLPNALEAFKKKAGRTLNICIHALVKMTHEENSGWKVKMTLVGPCPEQGAHL
jgi:hypothetical protein